jgi:hypothetical protein
MAGERRIAYPRPGTIGATAMYSLEFEEETGILKVTVFGFFTDEVAAQFGHDFPRAVRSARARTSELRTLMDATVGTVMTPAVAARMKGLEEAFVTEPSDRAAVIVGSSLHKLQIRRIFDPRRTQVFVSENAARIWLLAYDVEPGSLPARNLGWPRLTDAPAASLPASHLLSPQSRYLRASSPGRKPSETASDRNPPVLISRQDGDRFFTGPSVRWSVPGHAPGISPAATIMPLGHL